MPKDIKFIINTRVAYIMNENNFLFQMILITLILASAFLLALLVWKYKKQKDKYEEISNYLSKLHANNVSVNR